MVGRALLYPPDGDVAAAVDIAADLVHGSVSDLLGAHAPARRDGSDNSSWVRPPGQHRRRRVLRRDHPDGREPGHGWQHTRLRVAALAAGGHVEHESRDEETLVVPLVGSFRVTVTEADGTTHDLALTGRGSVFDGPTDVVYAGRGSRVHVTHVGPDAGRVALCGAPASGGRAEAVPAPPASEVPVELRGAGLASREVRNLGLPDVLDADSFLVCEVVTPAGNWSSWPPHKHDEERPGEETELEEIYYVETRSTDRGAPTRSATCGSTAPRTGRSTCWPRCAPATSCSSRTAGTAQRSQPGRRPVLPQRHGRPGTGAGLADLRRPGPRLGPRDLGRRGRRPPTALWRTPDDRRPSGSPSPRRSCASSPTSGPSATASGNGSSPGASASSATATSPGIGQALLQEEVRATTPARPGPAVRARPQRAGDGAHRGRPTPARRTGSRPGPCTASVGPGSTNMLTGAALATINRLPVLLLPSGTFATRASAPVLQELELPYAGDVTVNDASGRCRKFFDEVDRPEQLPRRLLGAMRVLADPVETGAVTISLPAGRAGRGLRLAGGALRRAGLARRPPAAPRRPRIAGGGGRHPPAKRPIVVAGGGVHYSGAEDALRAFCEATGIPVGEAQAGKGSLPHGHPQRVGAVGSTGTTAANALAHEADVVIGIGTRCSDFTTASRTAFQDSGVRFVNINVAALRRRQAQRPVRRRRRPRGAHRAHRRARRAGRCPAYRDRQASLWKEWDAQVEAAYDPPTSRDRRSSPPGLLTQGAVIGGVNELTDPRDVVVCAAGSMPGDIHKLWRVRDRKAYHVEYGFSCMGYEIPASHRRQARRPDPRGLRDGRRRRLPDDADRARHRRPGAGQGRRRARAEPRLPLDRLALREPGLPALRHQLPDARRGVAAGSTATCVPVDLAANARSLGCHVIEVHSRAELEAAIAEARALPQDGGPVVIHVETDPLVHAPDSDSWWDVPVSEVSSLASTTGRTGPTPGTRQPSVPS